LPYGFYPFSSSLMIPLRLGAIAPHRITKILLSSFECLVQLRLLFLETFAVLQSETFVGDHSRDGALLHFRPVFFLPELPSFHSPFDSLRNPVYHFAFGSW